MTISEAIEILELNPRITYTEDELKKLYRKKSHIYHPDNIETGNEDKFKEMKKAYETIKNNINQTNELTKLKESLSPSITYIVDEIIKINIYLNTPNLEPIHSLLKEHLTTWIKYLLPFSNSELLNTNIVIITNSYTQATQLLIKKILINIYTEYQIKNISSHIKQKTLRQLESLVNKKFKNLIEAIETISNVLEKIEQEIEIDRIKSIKSFKSDPLKKNKILEKYKKYPEYKYVKKEIDLLFNDLSWLVNTKKDPQVILEDKIEQIFFDYFFLAINKEQIAVKKYRQLIQSISFMINDDIVLPIIDEYINYLTDLEISSVNLAATSYETLNVSYQIETFEMLSNIKQAYYMSIINTTNQELFGTKIWEYISNILNHLFEQSNNNSHAHQNIETIFGMFSDQKLLNQIKRESKIIVDRALQIELATFRDNQKTSYYNFSRTILNTLLNEISKSSNELIENSQNVFEVLIIYRSIIIETRLTFEVFNEYSNQQRSLLLSHCVEEIKQKVKERKK